MKILTSKTLLVLLIGLLAFNSPLQSQQDKSNRPSPPAQTTASVSGVDVTFDYSQPAVKDRKTTTGDAKTSSKSNNTNKTKGASPCAARAYDNL